MSQGEQKDSITTLRKWNLIAGGIDPINDVIPASVGYGLEEGLQFAMSEISRLEERYNRLEAAGDELYAHLAWVSGPACFKRTPLSRSWIEAKDSKAWALQKERCLREPERQKLVQQIVHLADDLTLSYKQHLETLQAFSEALHRIKRLEETIEQLTRGTKP